MARQPLRPFDAPQVGDHRTRKVEGARLRVEHHFRGVGIFEGFETVRRGERPDQRGDVGRRIVEAAFHGFQLRGPDKRFVALHVDHHVVGLALFEIGFPATVGAAFVVRRGHLGPAAESEHGIVDTLVVGGDHDVIQHARHLLIDAPNDGLAAQHRQRLARKARRGVTRRYDCDKFHRLGYLAIKIKSKR